MTRYKLKKKSKMEEVKGKKATAVKVDKSKMRFEGC